MSFLPEKGKIFLILPVVGKSCLITRNGENKNYVKYPWKKKLKIDVTLASAAKIQTGATGWLP